MSKNFPGCEDCWHNYHCSMPQEGYDYDPKTCPWNPDNEKKKNNETLRQHTTNTGRWNVEG